MERELGLSVLREKGTQCKHMIEDSVKGEIITKLTHVKKKKERGIGRLIRDASPLVYFTAT